MLPEKHVLSQLLGSLYDAAADSGLWSRFLKDFLNVMRANAAGLLMHDFRHNHHSVVQQFGLDPNDVRRYYNQSPQIDDIWTQRARPVVHPGWTGVSQQLCAENELLRSEFYNECLRKLNVEHGLFGVIHNDAPYIANISIYRTARQQAFESRQLETLNFFMPHLRRAFHLHFQLAEMHKQNESLVSALNMLPTSVFILDSDGRILFMNRGAADLIARQDGLICKRERLRAEQPRESSSLEFLIRESAATSVGNGLGSGGSIFVSRKSYPPLRIVVTPARGIHLATQQPATVIAFVIDVAQRIRPRNDILRSMFRLAPAECRLALLLGDGKSLSEISQEIGISRNTLKTQMASIYAKTGASRHSQLVRLLSQFPGDSGTQKTE